MCTICRITECVYILVYDMIVTYFHFGVCVRICKTCLSGGGGGGFMVISSCPYAVHTRWVHAIGCCAAAQSLYDSIKPERDSRVANRLIGAALGIRLPKPPPSKGTANTSRGAGAAASGKNRCSSPPRIDAWDD